jgi:hypothetical protein
MKIGGKRLDSTLTLTITLESDQLNRLVTEIPDHRVSVTFKPFFKDFNAPIRWPGSLIRPPASELLVKDKSRSALQTTP